MATQTTLGIVPVGGDVKRVVAHPSREHTDRLRDLLRPQVAHLDGVELAHGGRSLDKPVIAHGATGCRW
jgi:hypothetical protein